MKNVGVIGTGIFGTALALTAACAKNNVLCWARKQDVVDSINQKHINQKYLPDITLPTNIKATANIAEVFSFADTILLTVSAQATRAVLQEMKPFVKNRHTIILCAKGLEVESGKMLSEVAQEEIPQATIAVLSGPGFAIDLAQKKLTSVTIACAQEGVAADLIDIFATPSFRPYTTTDMISPQIGGSVKNVIAIAAGIIEGAKLGAGARAALITRGLVEMGRLCKAMGGLETTVMGMSGLGDLVLTTGSAQSNFSFGYEIGLCGHAKKLIENNTQTVEGLHTASAVVKLAQKLKIEMPICEMVNRILFEGISLKSALEELMSRPYKEEGF